MVEATNKAAGDNQTAEAYSDDFCPHMALLGVCLEPAMCFLKHPTDGGTTAQTAALSTAAKEFNPFAAQPTAATKEWNPNAAAPQSEQAGIMEMLKQMGLEAQIDPDMGTIFMPPSESCTCC